VFLKQKIRVIFVFLLVLWETLTCFDSLRRNIDIISSWETLKIE
jgi:hypothetical protein